MRKVLIGIGVLLLLVVGAVAILPFVIDVDKFRPMIAEAVEKNMNAKVAIGKIDLSVMKGLGVKVESFVLTPTTGRDTKPVVEVGKLSASIPWYRLLVSPVINVNVEAPIIRVVQKKDGALNLMDLPKKSGAPTEAPKLPTTDATPTASKTGGSAIPALVRAASVNVIIQNGTLHFHDAAGKLVELKPFSVELKNVSLSKEMTLISAITLELESKPQMEVSGKLALEVHVKPEVSNTGEFRSADFNGKIDLSDLGFLYHPVFRKKRGETLSLDLSGKYTTEAFELTRMGLKMGQSAVKLSGAADLKNVANPGLNFSLELNPLHLKEATTWLSGVGDASGTVVLHANLKGTLLQPQIAMDLHVDGKNIKPEGVKAALDEIRVKMQLNATASKAAEGYQATQATVSIPEMHIVQGSEKLNGHLSLKGNEKAADLSLALESDNFDLDALTGGPTAATGAPAGVGSTGKSDGSTTAAAVMPLPERLKEIDKQLKSLKKITLLKNSKGTININFKKLKASGLQFQKFAFSALADKLDFKMKEFSLEVFQGKVHSVGELNLRGQEPVLNGSLDVAGLDLDPATKFAAPSLAGLVSGQAFVKGKFGTNGILWEDLNRDLTGSGEFEVKNGQLSTIPIGKWVNEALGKVTILNKFSGKIGSSAGKEYGDKFKSLVAKATIAKGVANLNPITIEYTTGDVGFGGTGTVDFSQNLNFNGNAKVSSTLVPVPELKGADGRVWAPLRFDGKLSQPKVDYAYTVSEISKVYAKKKGESVVKEQMKKVIDQPKVQEGLKGLLKKGKLF